MIITTDHGTHLDIFTRLFADVQRTSAFSGDFSGDLVGFKGEQDVASFDLVTFFEVPFGDLTTGDGFAECGYFDV